MYSKDCRILLIKILIIRYFILVILRCEYYFIFDVFV